MSAGWSGDGLSVYYTGMSASHPKITVTRRLPEPVEADIRERFDATWLPEDAGADGIAHALQHADGILCTVTDPLSASVLAKTVRCRILANFGVGTDHIDLAAAARHGLVVTNTPGVLTDATADLTLALILMVLRRAGEGERLVRARRWTGWSPTQLLGRDVTGRVLGVIGMGRIGQAVARRAAQGFGMSILYHSPRPVDPTALAGIPARGCSLDRLLAESDIVSLHCPATPETTGLIDARRLARMRADAVLINTARGAIVDEEALAEALEQGRLAGAGLDVYAAEPRVPERLRRLEQVVLLPHLGSATIEARTAMGRMAVENLSAFFAGGPVLHRVA